MLYFKLLHSVCILTVKPKHPQVWVGWIVDLVISVLCDLISWLKEKKVTLFMYLLNANEDIL